MDVKKSVKIDVSFSSFLTKRLKRDGKYVAMSHIRKPFDGVRDGWISGYVRQKYNDDEYSIYNIQDLELIQEVEAAKGCIPLYYLFRKSNIPEMVDVRDLELYRILGDEQAVVDDQSTFALSRVSIKSRSRDVYEYLAQILEEYREFMSEDTRSFKLNIELILSFKQMELEPDYDYLLDQDESEQEQREMRRSYIR